MQEITCQEGLTMFALQLLKGLFVFSVCLIRSGADVELLEI